MARPVNADAHATQARILATAYQLFATKGIDGASIRDIARGAGVSLAMVHHYFGSKQGLYGSCVEAMLGELQGLGLELAAPLADGALRPAQLVDRAVRVGFGFARQKRTAIRLLQRSLVDTGEVDASVRDRNMVPFLDSTSSLLGGLLDRPPASLRLPLQSAVFLVVRYSLASERELSALTGPLPPDKPASVAVEDHLVEATKALLGIPNG